MTAVAAGRGDDAVLVLPSAGPDPIPLPTALAAVLGYARGRRPLFFRSPSQPQGRWVQVLAYAHDRFDGQAPETADGPTDRDVLVAEGLHGRLDPAAWREVRSTLDDVWPLVRDMVERAAGRPLWELPDDEFSVLGEPGTVGAALRALGEPPGPHGRYVVAALHHRRPALVPLVTRTTWLQLVPHLVEGDSGVAAVVHRELQGNAEAFAALEDVVAGLLGHRLTRLRLHDLLLWLTATLRLPAAVALGRDTAEWPGDGQPAGRQPGSRPVSPSSWSSSGAPAGTGTSGP
jgi:hypothetical protein